MKEWWDGLFGYDGYCLISIIDKGTILGDGNISSFTQMISVENGNGDANLGGQVIEGVYIHLF